MSEVGYTLVAGGAGFLGSHLCKRLVEDGDNVLCVDNLCTGSLINLKKLEGTNNFIFLEEDIIELTRSKLPIKRIFNLACPAPALSKGSIFTGTCFEGSLNLLNIAKDMKFLF